MKNTSNSLSNGEFKNFCKKKMMYYEELIQKTIKSTNTYKNFDVYGINEIKTCIKNIETIYATIQDLNEKINNVTNGQDEIVKKVQEINDDLCCIFKTFGTEKVYDVLYVNFGIEYVKLLETTVDKNLYSIIKQFVKPINFNIIPWKKNTRQSKINKKLAKNRIVEDFSIVETSNTLDCFDLARTSRNFLTKVYGIKISFNNETKRKTMILCGLVDDIFLKCFSHPFVETRLLSIEQNKPKRY